MFLPVLYAILIALIVVEIGIVAWTVNFLRKYAFRPNPKFADDPDAAEWPASVPEWKRIAFARPARRGSATARAQEAVFSRLERFRHLREAGHRH
ncbi:MAG: hypothetical protein JO021_20835 [Alphaproteobacteria bacterium]|nr:hypothetical protein [Alphaproteobacteria bacterium]